MPRVAHENYIATRSFFFLGESVTGVCDVSSKSFFFLDGEHR